MHKQTPHVASTHVAWQPNLLTMDTILIIILLSLHKTHKYNDNTVLQNNCNSISSHIGQHSSHYIHIISFIPLIISCINWTNTKHCQYKSHNIAIDIHTIWYIGRESSLIFRNNDHIRLGMLLWWCNQSLMIMMWSIISLLVCVHYLTNKALTIYLWLQMVYTFERNHRCNLFHVMPTAMSCGICQ